MAPRYRSNTIFGTYNLFSDSFLSLFYPYLLSQPIPIFFTIPSHRKSSILPIAHFSMTYRERLYLHLAYYRSFPLLVHQIVPQYRNHCSSNFFSLHFSIRPSYTNFLVLVPVTIPVSSYSADPAYPAPKCRIRQTQPYFTF